MKKCFTGSFPSEKDAYTPWNFAGKLCWVHLICKLLPLCTPKLFLMKVTTTERSPWSKCSTYIHMLARSYHILACQGKTIRAQSNLPEKVRLPRRSSRKHRAKTQPVSFLAMPPFKSSSLSLQEGISETSSALEMGITWKALLNTASQIFYPREADSMGF
jgi:hypothetical protein